MASETDTIALTRVARLFHILTALNSRGPRTRVSRADLADECDCTVRTIQRDIELLQDHAHVPIRYDRPSRTYTLDATDWAYPIVSLTLPDALALALARGLLAAPGFPHKAAVLAALDKTTAGLTPTLRAAMAQTEDALHVEPLGRDYSNAPVSPLLEAAQARRSVEIDYASRSGGRRGWRRVDPYKVALRNGQNWEMHAWCHTNQAVRTFALDQIQGLKITADEFAVRADEWAAFQREAGVIGGLRSGPEIAVRVRFSPDIAAYAADIRWADTLHLEPQSDGALLLTGAVRGADGILVEILRWRRHAHVLGGPELRARVTEEIEAMAALYAEK